MTTAKEIMTTKVVVVQPHESLRDAAEKMHKEHVSGLPVADQDHHVYGIVTEADIMRFLYPFPAAAEGKRSAATGERQNRGLVRWFLESADYEKNAETYRKMQSTPVSELMTKTVVSGSPDDGIGHLVRLMQERQINRVPILDNGRLVGIVARSDVVRLASGGAKKKQTLIPEAGYR
ncbi:MAG TPA: CBS domain-containing protein [Thermoplasmata archaeon]|nr:CBS domain-containing protein [Thermoplasmata archaeon]